MTIYLQIAPNAASLSGEVAPSTSVRRLGALAITDRLERRFGQCGRELSVAPTMRSRVQTVALSPGLFLPAGRHHFGGEVETFTERHAGSQALHRRGHAGPERIMVGEPIQSSRLPT